MQRGTHLPGWCQTLVIHTAWAALSLFINTQSFAWTPAVASSGKSLGGMTDLDFNCCSFGSFPFFLIILFGLIHFKWLKWITIPDNGGHSGSHFFYHQKGYINSKCVHACVRLHPHGYVFYIVVYSTCIYFVFLRLFLGSFLVFLSDRAA